MKTFEFHDEVNLSAKRSEVFSFFSNANNLELITPPWVKFRILTPPPIVMKVGALIDYRLRIHGVPIGWRTEITGWNPPYRFVDEQRRGPYRLWRHTHDFEESGGKTLCRDRVEYAVWGGTLIHRLFVMKDIERIFAYRKVQILKRFSGESVGAQKA